MRPLCHVMLIHSDTPWYPMGLQVRLVDLFWKFWLQDIQLLPTSGHLMTEQMSSFWCSLFRHDISTVLGQWDKVLRKTFTWGDLLQLVILAVCHRIGLLWITVDAIENMTWNVYPQIKSLYVHVRGLFADSTKKNTSSHIWSSYCGKAIKSNQRLQLRLLKVMVELPPGNPVQSTSVDQGMFYTAHGFTYAMLGQVAWKPSASVPNDPDMNGLAGGHCSERFFTFQSCRSIAIPFPLWFILTSKRWGCGFACTKDTRNQCRIVEFQSYSKCSRVLLRHKQQTQEWCTALHFVEGQQPRSLPICDIIVAYFWNDAKWLPNVSNKVFSVKLSKSETSLYFR